MRTQAFRISVLFAVIVVSIVAYLAGYGRGQNEAVRSGTQFSLLSYSALYRYAQQGDTNQLNDKLRVLIFSHYDYYQRYFSKDTVSPEFSKRLDEARIIADQERTNVVTFDPAAFIGQLNAEMRTNREPTQVRTNK